MSHNESVMNYPSPFAAVESSLRLLCEGPQPLAIDGADIDAAFPQRAVPLVELRELLLSRRFPSEVRNRAVGVVVARAQQEEGVWLVAAAGLMLPRLGRASASLVRLCPHRKRDIQAEMFRVKVGRSSGLSMLGSVIVLSGLSLSGR